MRRVLGGVAVVVLIVLAGCSGTTVPIEPGTTAPTTTAEPAEPVHPQDPPEDILGWEDGYWYNETLDVDQSDGLNDSELDAVVARSMARVEHLRGLEFEESVDVEVISREEHRERTNERYSNATTNATIHQNVKFEALFLMNETTSATSAQEENLGSNVLGYYAPGQDRIVIVSENEENPQIDEITLSQELFHALQEHRFNASEIEGRTEEGHNARAGIIEGDGNYVDHLYEQACENGWQCYRPDPVSGGSGGGGDTHVGLLALRLQPYSDGPVFVEERYESGGWEAVNEVYDAPPQSTEQTIHTEKYRSDEPTTVTIEDRSNAAWSVPEMGNGSVNYARFGEAGMYVMLWYPSYVETDPGDINDVIIPYRDFFAPGNEPGIDQYNYDHRYSAGWDGDRLLPYATENSSETGETGYVWKSVWDSESQAAEFVAGYERLLDYHGAEAVPERPNTYRITDGGFADAFYVDRYGNTVVIVNAPTVENLSAVRSGAGVAE